MDELVGVASVVGWIFTTAIGWHSQKHLRGFGRLWWWTLALVVWPIIVAVNTGLWDPQGWLLFSLMTAVALMAVTLAIYSVLDLRSARKEVAESVARLERLIERADRNEQ